MREVVTAERRRDRRRGVLPARPHGLRGNGRADQRERRRRGFQHDRAARRSSPFLEELYDSGFSERGGQLVCTYFDENFLNLVPAAHVEGLYGCLDYYHEPSSDPFSRELLAQLRRALSRRCEVHRRQRLHRACIAGLKLWAAAVTEAGSLEQDDVIAALDHARSPRDPAARRQMVPGQHHLRMNMYIAQAGNGHFEVVKSLGAIDPKEQLLAAR